MFEIIGPENPMYYAVLLKDIQGLVGRRLPFDERSCSCPAIPLSRRLQALLDDIASISLCKKGNVSATAVCLKNDKGPTGTLETQLYIVFNKQDEAHSRCAQHLQSIFSMLCQVPFKPPVRGSPQLVAEDLHEHLIKICNTIQNYSFDILLRRVTKHQTNLSAITKLIEQDRKRFTPEQHSTLLDFLDDVDLIISTVTEAEAKQLSTAQTKMFIGIYSLWMKCGLLPRDSLANDGFTLLDHADVYLAECGAGVPLRRWAVKIMSFVISANRLFILTQSHRLHKLLEGEFRVQVLDSPTTRPYHCDLSFETTQAALNAALVGTKYLDQQWEEERLSYSAFQERGVTCWTPCVHAELALLIAMVDHKIKHLPYIGVSKLSCIMCVHYMRVFGEITGEKITIRGSHRKAYPGWFWPSHPDSGCDKALHQAFLNAIRGQVLSDFERESHRRKSDSSVGSEGPIVDMGLDKAELRMLSKVKAT